MNRTHPGYALTAVALLSLAGCSGGGGVFATPSPFRGTWSGTFTDAAQNGNLNLIITSAGVVAGNIKNITTNASGAVSGQVINSGAATLTYTYPAAGYTAKGALTINNTGHLLGNLSVTNNNGGAFVTAESIDLSKQ